MAEFDESAETELTADEAFPTTKSAKECRATSVVAARIRIF